MNLIIVSDLTCKEGLYFRYVTMVAKHDLSCSVLIESEKNDIDYHFHTLKSHGWFDFVDDFVEPRHRINGIRIDTKLNYPLTVRTQEITCYNSFNLINQIKKLKNIR